MIGSTSVIPSIHNFNLAKMMTKSFKDILLGFYTLLPMVVVGIAALVGWEVQMSVNGIGSVVVAQWLQLQPLT